MNKAVRNEIMTVQTRFTPDATNTRAYRDALGQFSTGVTVITAQTADGPTGMTANSFTSVSLDPPLVLWSLAKSSARYGVFAGAERFAINVLNAAQGELALLFAKDGGHFTETNSYAHHGLPLLRGVLSAFECELEKTVDAGDHTLILGRVSNVTLGDGAPLVFHRGKFGGFHQS